MTWGLYIRWIYSMDFLDIWHMFEYQAATIEYEYFVSFVQIYSSIETKVVKA